MATNILFIMSDSLVPHLAGPYGDTVGSTPNLDRLASAGVVFDNAYCNSPLCAPSRASMVTGRYVSEINAFDNGSEFASEWPTMGHVLGAAGYDTPIIGKMHFIGHDQHHGFDRRIALGTDYSKKYDPDEYKLGYAWDQPSAGNPWGVDWMGPSYVRSEQWDHYPTHYERDNEIHREGLAYLSEKGPGCDPFFCCVSYHAPHNPFWIPHVIRQQFRGKDLPLPSIPEGVTTRHGPMDTWLDDFHYEPEIRDRLMDPENLRWLYETYYGIVFDLDRRIGELLQTLEHRGLAESTAVIFASDHGDMLAHRGMVQKRCFYERSSRVGLIFSFPGRWQQGVRLSRPVSLIDLLPTFVELANGPLPDDLPGQDLLQSVEDGTEPEDRTVFSEYHGEGVHAPCFMARRNEFKYVYVHGYEERLYNVANDPDEFVNLIEHEQYEPVVSELRAELLSQFDPDLVAAKARTSQRNRGFVYRCTRMQHDGAAGGQEPAK